MKSLKIYFKDNDWISFQVDGNLYSEDMICKMMYRLSKSYDGRLLGIRFRSIRFEMKSVNSNKSLEVQSREISKALLHEKIRAMIYRETKELREMIMARALFSASVSEVQPEREYSFQGEEENDEIFCDWFELNQE